MHLQVLKFIEQTSSVLSGVRQESHRLMYCDGRKDDWQFVLALVRNKCRVLSELIWEITLLIKIPSKCHLPSSASTMEILPNDSNFLMKQIE